MTVRAWLKEPPPPGPAAAEALPAAAATEALPLMTAREAIADRAPPPAPWTSWAQVRQVRQAVGADRFLLLRRPEHLTGAQRQVFEAVFASPIGRPVRLARAFLEEWYAMWRDDTGERRPVDAARARYDRWRADAEYATIPPLRKVQRRMDDAHFAHLSPFLRDPRWEGTNNGAERMGRTFRHLQASRFGLRTDEAREGRWSRMRCTAATTFRRTGRARSVARAAGNGSPRRPHGNSPEPHDRGRSASPAAIPVQRQLRSVTKPPANYRDH